MRELLEALVAMAAMALAGLDVIIIWGLMQ